MNRTLNLLLPYIHCLVTVSPSQDTEEHRQSLVHPDTALYTLYYYQNAIKQIRINKL
jgi:hypothetical protein